MKRRQFFRIKSSHSVASTFGVADAAMASPPAKTKKLLLALFTLLVQPFNSLGRQSDESGIVWMNRRPVARRSARRLDESGYFWTNRQEGTALRGGKRTAPLGAVQPTSMLGGDQRADRILNACGLERADGIHSEQPRGVIDSPPLPRCCLSARSPAATD